MVKIGIFEIGSDKPVRVQSMLSIPVEKVEECVRQIEELTEAGCDMIRLAVPRLKDCNFLEKIKNKLTKKGTGLPLIADVQFNPDIAIEAARIVEKVRINPGNFFEEKTLSGNYPENLADTAKNKILHLAEICKANKTALRIGSNHGSLSQRIKYLHGNTAHALAGSVLEYARIFNAAGFDDLVLSVKSSDIQLTLESNRLLKKGMDKEKMNYPIHLGLTEAGSQKEGIVKSAMAIGTLLLEGIGDTIRVSLAGNPVEEIPVAKAIINSVEAILSSTKLIFPLPVQKKVISNKKFPLIIADTNADIPACLDEVFYFSPGKNNIFSNKKHLIKFLSLNAIPEETEKNHAFYININKSLKGVDSIVEKKGEFPQIPVMTGITNSSFYGIKKLVDTSVKAGILLTNNLTEGIYLPDLELEEVALLIQASGRKNYKAEYIICPSCGRTQFKINKLSREVKQQTGHLKGLKIAVMGCIINGQGEMAGADFGLMGAGKGLVHLFKGSQLVKKNVSVESSVRELISLIKIEGKWTDRL